MNTRHRIGAWNCSESWRFKDGSHSCSHTCFCLQHQSSESPVSPECQKHVAHVGMFSDDSDFSTIDNICVSKLFYLPSLPLSSTTLTRPQGPPPFSQVLVCLRPTSAYGLCLLTVLPPICCFWTLMDQSDSSRLASASVVPTLEALWCQCG